MKGEETRSDRIDMGTERREARCGIIQKRKTGTDRIKGL